jgi:hypothetical protein
MPTFPLGKTLQFYNAQYALQGYMYDYSPEWTVGEVDKTHFSTSYHKEKQPGLISSKIPFKGHYINSGSGSDLLENLILAAQRTETINTVAYPDGTAGSDADLWTANGISRAVAVKADDELITLDTEHLAKEGQHGGLVLAALGAVSGAPFSTTGLDFGGAAWSVGTYTWLTLHGLRGARSPPLAP